MLARVLSDVFAVQAEASLRAGSRRKGDAWLALSSWLAPLRPEVLCRAAIAASQSGKRDQAAGYCERALTLEPENAQAHQILSELFLHGDYYLDVLARIHAALQPRTYIEIGVETGASIRRVPSSTRAIGVDPHPVIDFDLPAHIAIFAQTSDEFFARPDVSDHLGGLPLDLAFIDGMHHFEFALRDFINVERLCHGGSVILIHDCFPHDRRTAERVRHTGFWSGDVWRLLALLKTHRPDLVLHTIATPPTGLAIATNLNPTSRVLEARLDELTAEFMRLDYDFLQADRAGKLNLFPNDWAKIQTLLPSAAARP